MTLKALDLIYPRFCIGCDTIVRDRENHICWDCFSSVDILSEPICSVCGDPADGMIEHEYTCSWCVNRRPYFERARSAVRHRGIIRDTLHSFKYNNNIHLSSDLAELLVSCVRTHYFGDEFDAITVVPLEAQRQRKRSYNQSSLIGSKLAKAIGLRCVHDCLMRTRAVRPQVELNARQRRLNVEGIFEVKEKAWVKGRSLLLVDDVMTTGATVNEVSKVLKEAGAVKVCVATVARG